jgi:hypothetical protein
VFGLFLGIQEVARNGAGNVTAFRESGICTVTERECEGPDSSGRNLTHVAGIHHPFLHPVLNQENVDRISSHEAER